MFNKKFFLLSIFLIALLSISVASATDVQSDDIANEDSNVQLELSEIDYIGEDSNIESVSNSDICDDCVDSESLTKSKSILSEDDFQEFYEDEEWDGNDEYDEDYISQSSDPKAYLQPKILYYDPSSSYRREKYEYDWDNIF